MHNPPHLSRNQKKRIKYMCVSWVSDLLKVPQGLKPGDRGAF
jgi:hypothetical protein